MLNRLRSRLSAPLAISLIALFAALGGGAAIALPGKNTIDSGDIKKNAVKSSDIKNDKVTGADVKESTLNIPQQALPDNVFGVSFLDGGNIQVASLNGTTVQKSSNVFTIHFPRSVQGCIPVATGWFDGSTRALLSGTGNPNDVLVSNDSGTAANLIVFCP
jgi:hypothetical protein